MYFDFNNTLDVQENLDSVHIAYGPTIAVSNPYYATPIPEEEEFDIKAEKTLSNTDEDTKEIKRKRGPKRRQTSKEKLLKSRARSKTTRLRKKNYIKHLEDKVHDLEQENFRLQNVILTYKRQEIEDFNNKDMQIFTQSASKTPSTNFGDSETGLSKNWEADQIPSDLETTSTQLLEKHSKFVDSIFKKLVDNIHPFKQHSYWKDLNGDYIRNYQEIKEFARCSKYKIPEFEQQHAFTKVDKYVTSFAPSQEQFSFLVDRLNKEAQIKSQFEQAIHNLIQAKVIIQESAFEFYKLDQIFKKSDVISNEQRQNAIISEKVVLQDASTSIWSLKNTEKEYNYDIT